MEWLAATRDILIIIVALVALAAHILLIILGWRIWRLVKALKAEIDPILASMHRTSDALRGTTMLVGDVIVGPTAKFAATMAAFQSLVRNLTVLGRAGRRA